MMIYDCMLYDDEIDLLEIRLRETESVVNEWVIVEGTHTYQGAKKSVTLQDHKARLLPWIKRIRHVMHPADGQHPFAREHSQRRAVGNVLESLGVFEADIVHFSDLDEITSAHTFLEYLAIPSSQDRPRETMSVPHSLSYYWLNCVGGLWSAAKIGEWGQIKDKFGLDMQALRMAGCHSFPHAGGWHFSYMGGIAGIQSKLSRFSHNDLNTKEFCCPKHIGLCRATGADLFNRGGFYSFAPMDGLPRCVQDGHLRHLAADVSFSERWYHPTDLVRMCRVGEKAMEAKGVVIDVGPWEGASTCALSHAFPNDRVLAVDTWQGFALDGPNHPRAEVSSRRRVLPRFLSNVRALGLGNVTAVESEPAKFLESLCFPVKFVHLDGCHHYDSVSREIKAAKAVLSPGGIICGDDFLTASATRMDLCGGVERAVKSLLPGFVQDGNQWHWQKNS